jgi:type I restriction enzyme S subunit
MIENNIPKHWQVKKLGEVCNFIGGGTPSKSNTSYWNGLIPWASIKDIKGQYLTKTIDLITEIGVKNSATNLANPDEIILATRINPGRPIISKIKTAINQDLKIAKPKEKINTLFLYYAFLNIEKEVIKKSNGTTVLGITLNTLNEIVIYLPPLPEQLAIVSKIEELLSDLENGKQQLITAQQQLKVYRQSLLKAAFEGKLSLNCDSFDLYDKDDLKRNSINHDNTINQGSDNLPKGWKWVKLGDICINVEYGSSIKSKKEGKTPVLRMGNIQKGIFDWTDLVYSDDDFEINKYLLKKNDVLFNRTNSAELVGKTAIYKGERPAIFAGYLIRINRIESIIDANYLTYYLNTLAAKEYGNSIRSFGVNQSNINGTKLKTYPIPLPALAVQQQIIEILESKLTVCDNIEETIKEALLKSESLRQSILKKAFSGQLI